MGKSSQINFRTKNQQSNGVQNLFWKPKISIPCTFNHTPLDDSQQHQVGVHCHWHDNEFLCVTNRNNRKEMAKIWDKVPDIEKKMFRAPTPPIATWSGKSRCYCINHTGHTQILSI
jgi:hypothetical protein